MSAEHKTFVVKVQLPLSSNNRDAGALVYNKDRTFEALISIDDELVQGMEGRAKKFFEARLGDDGESLVLVGDAPEQEW